MHRQRQIGRRAWIASAALVTAWILAAAPSRGGPKPVVVYAVDFEKPVGAEWSVRRTEATPKGKRHFLGQFCNDRVTLRLARLPRHRYLRISFDLFIILSWDGNYPPDGPEPYGPDIWSLEVLNGPRLLHCTFAEWPVAPSHRQSYPDEYPGAAHPRRCGAAATGTLGYVRRNPDSFDAVYRLSFVLAHTGSEVTFAFEGSGLQFAADESWGLDNVKVEAFSRGHALEPKALALLWARLADSDPVTACGAIAPLVLAGDAASDFLAKSLPIPAVDQRKVAKLLAELDADDWKVRHRASVALQGMGPVVLPRLQAALRKPVSLEAKTRLEAVLAALESTDDPGLDAARLHRAFRVLAAGRGAHALRAMKRLREAAQGRRLQQRAQAAIARISNDLIQALLSEARADAKAGRFARASRACRKAHALATEVGHQAAPTLLQVLQSLKTDLEADPGVEALWRKLDAVLAAEGARAAELRRKALAVPHIRRRPVPPLPQKIRVRFAADPILPRDRL